MEVPEEKGKDSQTFLESVLLCPHRGPSRVTVPSAFALDLMPENVVEEKIKELDLNMVMAEIRREGRPGAQWR